MDLSAAIEYCLGAIKRRLGIEPIPVAARRWVTCRDCGRTESVETDGAHVCSHCGGMMREVL